MTQSDIDYKIEQLKEMLAAELSPDGGYGAHVSHWVGSIKPINIDAQALAALIAHYESREANG